MPSSWSTRLLVLLAIADMAATQTFVVDVLGGAGSNFTSIATAVAAVPSGAVLLVRPGTYDSFTIDGKSLAVLGSPGVFVSSAFGGVIGVANLAPTQSVTLHDLQTLSGLGQGRFELIGCQGVVHLQACGDPGAGAGAGALLTVQQCAEVRANDCWFEPPSLAPLTVANSSLFAARSRFLVVGYSGSGVSLVQSHLELTDCTIRGSIFAASVLLDATSSVRALGTSGLQGSLLAAAIGGSGSVTVDPGVVLTGTPPIAPGVAVVSRSMPALSLPATPIGGVAAASLQLPPGGIGGLFASLPVPRYSSPPFATALSLDPTASFVLAGGSTSPVTSSQTVPSVAALRGARLAWQGWSYDALQGWQASNAVVATFW